MGALKELASVKTGIIGYRLERNRYILFNSRFR